MKDFFLTCAHLLESGEDVVMVTIIRGEGSSPRTAGSRMLVRRNGSIAGTIGGGVFEAQAMRKAQDVFQSRQSMIEAFNFSGQDVKGMDMICGGKAEIFIDLLRHDLPENVAVCRAVSELKRHDYNALLITKLFTGQGSEDLAKLALITCKDASVGMPLSEADQEILRNQARNRHPQQVKLGETTYQIEPLNNPGTAYIFGAGHISQKLAPLTHLTDFQTVIVDDREEYANAERFPFADQIIVAENMDHCMKDLPISWDSYIVIVTRGHAYDLIVIDQALKTNAGYIGMIGSRRKREIIYQRLRQSGISEEALAKVHSPIGIDISAETPEEIAVSIIAEMIQVRAGHGKYSQP